MAYKGFLWVLQDFAKRCRGLFRDMAYTRSLKNLNPVTSGLQGALGALQDFMKVSGSFKNYSDSAG